MFADDRNRDTRYEYADRYDSRAIKFVRERTGDEIVRSQSGRGWERYRDGQFLHKIKVREISEAVEYGDWMKVISNA